MYIKIAPAESTDTNQHFSYLDDKVIQPVPLIFLSGERHLACGYPFSICIAFVGDTILKKLYRYVGGRCHSLIQYPPTDGRPIGGFIIQFSFQLAINLDGDRIMMVSPVWVDAFLGE